MRGIAGAVRAEQSVDLVDVNKVFERGFWRAPKHLKMQAQVAQDVVLHTTIQGRQTRQWPTEVVLGPGVEVDDVAHTDLGDQIVQLRRGQGIEARLKDAFFLRWAEDAENGSKFTDVARDGPGVDGFDARDAMMAQEFIHGADAVPVVRLFHGVTHDHATRPNAS